jgi:hypothetical protein
LELSRPEPEAKPFPSPTEFKNERSFTSTDLDGGYCYTTNPLLPNSDHKTVHDGHKVKKKESFPPLADITCMFSGNLAVVDSIVFVSNVFPNDTSPHGVRVTVRVNRWSEDL